MARSTVSISYQPAEGERLDASVDGGTSDEFTFEAMAATAVKAFTESLTAAVKTYGEATTPSKET